MVYPSIGQKHPCILNIWYSLKAHQEKTVISLPTSLLRSSFYFTSKLYAQQSQDAASRGISNTPSSQQVTNSTEMFRNHLSGLVHASESDFKADL